MIFAEITQMRCVGVFMENERRKMHHLQSEVRNISRQLSRLSGMDEICRSLESFIEDMETEHIAMRDMYHCLVCIQHEYVRCEEDITGFAEEKIRFGDKEEKFGRIDISKIFPKDISLLFY